MPDEVSGSTHDDESVVDIRAPKGNSDIDVVIKLRDPWLQLAATALMTQEGFRICEVDRGDNTYVITDDALIKGEHVTRIIDNRPGTAQASIEALLALDISGVITKKDPSLLPFAVNAVANGMLIAPKTVFAAARSMPFLTRSQAQVLQGVINGMSNQEIARTHGTSEGQVKRCITNLLRQFNAKSRSELINRTRDIGYQVRGR